MSVSGNTAGAITRPTMITTALANSHSSRRGLMYCRCAKAMMNVSRYSASGTTHSSGMDATSVEMNVVTLIISVEGMAASPSQRSRFAHTSSSAASSSCTGVAR